MTVLWTAHDAAQATGGKSAVDWAATGVSIDTRTLAPGDLFIALSAARDGHDFVRVAFEKGAAAAMVARVPEGLPNFARDCLLIVPDVLQGLTALGVAARDRLQAQAQVIAVTGSVGKTTVKDMLHTVLSTQGKTHVAQASYNNHWGVPLTLARMPVDTDYAVIEIGMNAPGEIAPLVRLAAPHAALVTTVAPAHLAAFADVAAIAHEKASIFDGLNPNGVALAHADITTAPILFAKAHAVGARLIRFGAAADIEARITDIALSDRATSARITLHGIEHALTINAPGRHLVLNALATLATADAVGVDAAKAVHALQAWRPTAGRGTHARLHLKGADHVVIDLIDDAFNANPASLAAAVEVLAAASLHPPGRRIAVLGDMLELGASAPERHAALAHLPAMARIDVVHTLGPLMAHLRAALPPEKRGLHADTAHDMAKTLPHTLQSGDRVLVKGSKGIGASLVVDALRKLRQAAGEG